MAEGRVCTGFSLPYVAKYANSSGTVSYTSGQKLARGVEVSIETETSEDNNFYANNMAAETQAGVFTGGTLNLTVDGLNIAAKRLILGLPTAGSDGFTDYGDSMTIPPVGVGFIARYQSGGVVTYVPYVLTKVMFNIPPIAAATQEEDIDWQTQELTAVIMRDDSSNHVWLREGDEEDSEADAESALKTALGITTGSGG